MELVTETAVALREAGLRCGLCGGMALAVYGEARETPDVAYVCPKEEVPLALAALGVLYPGAVLGGPETLPTGRIEQSLCIPNGIGSQAERLGTVTFVTHVSQRYVQGVMGRCVDVQLLGIPVVLIAPEDFLVFNMLSADFHDWEDAVGIAASCCRSIDSVFVEREIGALVAQSSEAPILQRWLEVRTRAKRWPLP